VRICFLFFVLFCFVFALCSLTLVECWYVPRDVEQGLFIKGVDRPTRLLQFVVFVHLPFSFRSLDLFCCLTRVYEGHRLHVMLYGGFLSRVES